MPNTTTLNTCLVGPAAVDGLAPVLLSFLQYDLALVLWHVDGIDVATGLNTEPRARTTCWNTFSGWNVNVFASIVLERWLCSVNFEMDLALWVVEGSNLLQLL
jgi:hypothetical protein